MPDAIAYKYLSENGCLKTLGNKTLRFSRPSTLNDPFDLYLDDLFNMELEDVLNVQHTTLLETLERDPERYAALTGTNIEKVRAASHVLRSASVQNRQYIRSSLELHREYDPDLRKLVELITEQRESVIKNFQNAAIFCATKNHDNLLMWAHYADQHRGAVLGFRPDVTGDSMLQYFEPVRYSNVRPSFYDLTEAWGVKLPDTLETAIEVNKVLMLTKSAHWKYEEEIRIVIGNQVPTNEDAVYLAYQPHELTEVYIGCRADRDFMRQTISAAKAINPNVSVFRVVLKSRSFELSFEKLE